jgi:hypothetical protein
MTVTRRRFLASAAAAAGSAALPSLPSPVVAPVVDAVAPAVAPTIEFTRAGVTIGRTTVYAVYEKLANGVIRVSAATARSS